MPAPAPALTLHSILTLVFFCIYSYLQKWQIEMIHPVVQMLEAKKKE